MRTLIVRYTPRSQSNTAALLEKISPQIQGKVEVLDLAKELPPLFVTASVDAYGKRNYGGQTLTPEEASALAHADRLTAQLKRADVVILATPMHNFGLPAAVKAWFDAVMQKGETWTIGAQGYEGFMKNSKALVLYASGGTYADAPGSWDTLTPLTKIEFGFMGFAETEVIAAQGMNQFPAEREARIEAAAKQAVAVLQRWYGVGQRARGLTDRDGTAQGAEPALSR